MSAILNAFGERRAAYQDSTNGTAGSDAEFYARLDAADAIIIHTPATTLAEYAAKLRTSLCGGDQGANDALVVHNLRHLLPDEDRDRAGLFEADWSGKLVWQVILDLERLDDRSAWDRAREAYVDALAWETATAKAPADDPKADAAQQARDVAEDALMAISSPDAAAFALKCRVAHGDGRETDCWNEMLDAEAKRFAGMTEIRA